MQNAIINGLIERLSVLAIILALAAPICKGQTDPDPHSDGAGTFFNTNANPYFQSGLSGQCTWYVWGRCATNGWILDFKRDAGHWGDASQYYDLAMPTGGRGQLPKLYSIQCTYPGSKPEFGTSHVAYVVHVQDETIGTYLNSTS